MSGRFDKDRSLALRAAPVRLIAVASTVLLLCGIASAQTATLDGFLDLLDQPPPNTDTYTVKLRIVDPRSRAVEFFWVGDLERDGDDFSGRIDNTPRSVTNVREGQVVRFTRAEIFDWMYVDSNFTNAKRCMVGNFTLCALLTREKPQEAAAMKREMGLVCD